MLGNHTKGKVFIFEFISSVNKSNVAIQQQDLQLRFKRPTIWISILGPLRPHSSPRPGGGKLRHCKRCSWSSVLHIRKCAVQCKHTATKDRAPCSASVSASAASPSISQTWLINQEASSGKMGMGWWKEERCLPVKLVCRALGQGNKGQA